MVIRKNPHQIKEEILFNLKDPLSVEQLRKKIESNWSTINYYVEELKKDKKVREIISTDKLRIYQKIDGDTYFNIPITKEERKKFRTLFFLIMEEYKSKKRFPTRTEFAKCAVHIIKKSNSELANLPTAWYLYGMIPLMVADPSQDYQEEFILKDKEEIKKLINIYISENKGKRAREIQQEQHQELNEELYNLSDEFSKLTNKQEWDDKKILGILNKFFIVCPIDNEFEEVFISTEKFISIMVKLSKLNDLENDRNKIVETFDALWKFIAVYKFYVSMTNGKNKKDKEKILRFYLRDTLEVRKKGAQEAISELDSIYFGKLVKFDAASINLSSEAQKARKIMADWRW